MKKLLITFNILLWLLCVAIPLNSAKADDKTNAIVGHIITETIKGTDIDSLEILEKEMQVLLHSVSIEMIGLLESHLPAILEGLAAEIRLKSDHKLKCKLLEKGGMNDGCI